jgi:hypothetical protein
MGKKGPYQASPSFTRTFGDDVTSEPSPICAPSPLIFTFCLIAWQAAGERSLANTYLKVGPMVKVALFGIEFTYLTWGISFAYRMERRPVADRASNITTP